MSIRNIKFAKYNEMDKVPIDVGQLDNKEINMYEHECALLLHNIFILPSYRNDSNLKSNINKYVFGLWNNETKEI